MFVTLLAVLVALAIGHLAPSLASALRQFHWYEGWLHWLDQQLSSHRAWRGRYGILIALAPPLLLVALIQAALQGPMLGFGLLLFGVAVLFYAWGPRDLDVDVDAVVDALDTAARRDAIARLEVANAPRTHARSSHDAPALVEAVFRSALRRWFGVLFWFLLLGAFGALLYRLTAIAASNPPRAALPTETAAGAQWLLDILDWPVAQLMTLSLALVGNFDVVVGAWKDAGGAAARLGNGFLGAAARASVRSEIADEAEDQVLYDGEGSPAGVVRGLGPLPELRDAMSLVWRILLVWLAVLALFVVAGWVS